VPLRQFVLKIAARCNLDCDYCYVYSLRDSSWRTAERFMAPATARRAARRIAEHARTHAVAEVSVCLHGGEPLLMPIHEVERMLTDLRAGLEDASRVRFSVQTNGVLLDSTWLDLFARQDVAVSVSVDGDRATHDRHRRDRAGRASYEKVEQAVALLRSPQYRKLYAGLLAVIDVESDPVEFLESLFSQQAPRVDLLLPHATWQDPPRSAGSWLVAAFDHWYTRRPVPPLRTFEALLDLLLGGGPGCELLGTAPIGYVIVDTDGAYRQTEGLNAAYDRAAATGMTVFDASVDDVLTHPGLLTRQSGRDGLSAQCQACDLVDVCGGGHYAHRYRPGSGFDNPSVYCADLARLITHAAQRVEEDLRRAVATRGAGGGAT
jgi:uncharacterized protein